MTDPTNTDVFETIEDVVNEMVLDGDITSADDALDIMITVALDTRPEV